MNNNEKDELRKEIEFLINKAKELEEKLKKIETQEKNTESLNILEQQLKSILPIPKKEKVNKISSVSNNDAKLLLVLNKFPSEIATNTIDALNNWFKELSNEALEDINNLYHLFIEKIKEIKINDIEDITLSAALTNGSHVIVLNVGSIGVYKYNSGAIEPILKNTEKDTINAEIISNDEYQTIVLLSASETDDLSDERIKIINKNTNREQLALDLLEFKEENKKML